jgi:kelch-like protein 10
LEDGERNVLRINIETYDTSADRWVKIEEVDPTGQLTNHGMAVTGLNIYVIGGLT